MKAIHLNIFFVLLVLFSKGQPTRGPDDLVGYIDTYDMKWGVVDVTKEVFAGAICEKHRTLKT